MKWLCAGFLAIILLVGLASPVEAQVSCYSLTYVIQPGDTLSAIAERCNLSYPGLIGINYEIEDPDLIRPGQVIRLVASIPLYSTPADGAPQVGGLQEGGEVYIARPGDSLARIAYLYNTTVSALQQSNPNIGPDLVIQVGQPIQMPPDARREKGWLGVSIHTAGPGDQFEVRVVDFPPYADIDIRIGELFKQDQGDFQVYYYVTQVFRTDARGQARKTLTIPYYAWINEQWVVEVVTAEHEPPVRALSPIILISYY